MATLRSTNPWSILPSKIRGQTASVAAGFSPAFPKRRARSGWLQPGIFRTPRASPAPAGPPLQRLVARASRLAEFLYGLFFEIKRRTVRTTVRYSALTAATFFAAYLRTSMPDWLKSGTGLGRVQTTRHRLKQSPDSLSSTRIVCPRRRGLLVATLRPWSERSRIAPVNPLGLSLSASHTVTCMGLKTRGDRRSREYWGTGIDSSSSCVISRIPPGPASRHCHFSTGKDPAG